MPGARAAVGVGAAAGEKHLESSRASCPWPVQEGVPVPLSPYCMNVQGSPQKPATFLQVLHSLSEPLF